MEIFPYIFNTFANQKKSKKYSEICSFILK